MRSLVILVFINISPISSSDSHGGYDPPIRIRRYCLSCEDPNHFNKRTGLYDQHPSLRSQLIEENSEFPSLENVSSVLKEIDEDGERLGVYGPDVPHADWEVNGEWIGTRKEWTAEAVEEYLAATGESDEDDPETWVKRDAPLKDPDISAQVLITETKRPKHAQFSPFPTIASP